MQNTFCEPNSPAEVPQSREIVDPINKFAKSLREKGGQVVWVLHANTQIGGKSDWELFFNNVVTDEVKSRTIASLSPDKQKVWKDLTVDDRDITIIKNRYSALISGSSSLERVLRNLGIDTILIAGTKTNICCESTARDGMMLDFKIVMVEDCCAALSDDEHQAALESIIQQFGDVRTSTSLLEILK
jgi:ureidoacrylate peracid hydrolase